jgi:beta-N-acetylhexosaminidase
MDRDRKIRYLPGMTRFVLPLLICLGLTQPLAADPLPPSYLGKFLILPVFTPELSERDREIIRTIAPAGFLILGGAAKNPEQFVRLVGDLYAISEPDIPWIAVDEEGGRVSRLEKIIPPLPSQALRGALEKMNFESRSPGYLSDEAGLVRVRCSPLKSYGINMVLAPCADVLTHSDNRVIGSRSFGSDPRIVSDLVEMDLLCYKSAGLACVPKHWPGHGAVGEDSHKTLPRLAKTASEMRTVELLPFLELLEKNESRFLMLSHLLWTPVDPDHPVSLSGKSTEIIRATGWDGVLMSDDLAMGAVDQSAGLDRILLDALAAGNGLLLLTNPLEDCLTAVTNASKTLAADHDLTARLEPSAERNRKAKASFDLQGIKNGFQSATTQQRKNDSYQSYSWSRLACEKFLRQSGIPDRLAADGRKPLVFLSFEKDYALNGPGFRTVFVTGTTVAAEYERSLREGERIRFILSEKTPDTPLRELWSAKRPSAGTLVLCTGLFVPRGVPEGRCVQILDDRAMLRRMLAGALADRLPKTVGH